MELLYITNKVETAKNAEISGVDRFRKKRQNG